MGIDIHRNTLPRLGKAIESGNSNDRSVIGLVWALHELGGDPTPHLEKKYTKERATEIMDNIYMDEDAGEEMKLNILYIACVWAADAKKQIAGWRTYSLVEKVIDEIAKTAVRHWTFEPIFNQSSVPGVPQRNVSNACKKLIDLGLLSVVRHSTSRGQSNIYKMTTKDHSPEEVKAAFDALHLKTVTAADQLDEYLGTEKAPDEFAESRKKYDW
ncbi:hypothetical protein [Rhodococcus sp. JG-3]|uniref:hypothetical protein n=1 Tax=Rhodococcus sp. JG-3 TaxID=1305835 RepID=UPI001267DACE|nr:hypothetical protein [Rhodococcus sp. JG-3]